MRTTLTIDDSLLRDLKEVAHKMDAPLKEVIDTALRAGLESMQRRPQRKPFRVRTFAMGLPTQIKLDKALEVAAALEDDEVLRKIALRK